ncbi:TPA: hypothetical protein N0F65_002320 [Lagenidium giganteum]|uniref:Pre-rRNA-processing protein Ipi1 N-terminal domain-containing protein n=1 Tax=Lagenidium giganteum TaxID=4803 RepID=A0AAV2Z5T9_9STRA|nr:TPA: hypothetical protein N0F65_002320 [Lagenidium giganteum]
MGKPHNVKKKPADFKRPKRKVGRKAAPAANVTNVGITSRRINLLEQSVLQDKGDVVTHRHLTLSDLVAQIGHYNAHVRQKALQGLRELAQLHASNVLANVSVVLERFLPTFVDEEAVVRDAAVQAWKVLVSVMVEGKSLAPFAKLITVYFCSGLTHLQIGVRQDTLRAIGVLLETAPELISVDAGVERLGRLIENFRDMVAATPSQGIKVMNQYSALQGDSQSNKKKAKKGASTGNASALALRFSALKVLHKLLMSIDFTAATSDGVDSAAQRVGQGSARAANVNATKTLLLFPQPSLVAAHQADQLHKLGFWQEKSRCLLPALLELWIECLENELDTLEETHVEHMQYMMESMTVILSANREFLAQQAPTDEFARTAKKCRDQLLRLFPMFPNSTLAVNGDAYLAQWYGINVALTHCACVFLALPASFHGADLEDRVLTFMTDTLNKYHAADELRALSSTHGIIKALLNALATLLATPTAFADPARREAILQTFTQFYTRCSSKSMTFRVCTSFAADHLAVHHPWPQWTIVMEWIRCFGALLGHLELSHMALGRKCLFIMISVVKRLPTEWGEGEHMESVMNNLVALFNVTDAGAATDKKEQRMTHFDDLSSQDQMEFVALVYHLPRYPVELLRGLASCCKSEKVDVHTKSFIMDMLAQRRSCLDMAHLVSFLMSSILSRSSSAPATPAQRQAHVFLVNHVCRILVSMNLGISLSEILAPALSRHAAQLSTMDVLNLHTLVLLYGICFASAASKTTTSIPGAMEKDAVAVLAASLLQFGGNVEERVLTEDCLRAVALLPTVLVPLARAIILNIKGGSSADVSNALKVVQILLRSPEIQPQTARYRNELTKVVDEVSKQHPEHSAHADVVRQLRQVKGDLELVAVGQ